MRRLLSVLISLIFLALLTDVVYSKTLPEAGKKIFTNRFSTISLCISAPSFYISKNSQELEHELGFWFLGKKKPPHLGEICPPDSIIGGGVCAWLDFLVAYGYLQERKYPKYIVTEKLLPFLVTGDTMYSRYLMVAKLQLQSIDKVEKRQEGDYDIWRFAYSFILEPFFREFPRVGPYKLIGEIRYNRFLEKYEIKDYFTPSAGFDLKQYTNRDGRQFICHVEVEGSKNALTIWLANNREKWMPKSQSPSSFQDSQSTDEEPQKLKKFIADQWKQIIQIPQPKRDWRELVTLKITGKYDDYSDLYLMGVNRRNLASNALIAANTFLTKKNDLKNAQKYADLAVRHYIESNDLFKTAEMVFSGSVGMTAQALEAIYRGSKEASKYGWYLMCGPKCYEVADYIFLMTDLAVDYGLEGMDEAKKNLVISGFIKTLLKTGGVSKWIENRTTHLIGDSGLYGVMEKTISSPEFQKAFMKVVAESGAYATKETAETRAKMVINNSINLIKDSSNLKPKD